MSTRRCVRLAAGLLTVAIVAAGCAIPHKKSEFGVSKVAADSGEIDRIFDRYRKVRNNSLKLLDVQPLSTVESGPVLAIDSGSIRVSKQLGLEQTQDNGRLSVLEVLSPQVGSYPLWFLAVVRDEARDLVKVQIFERKTAVAEWSLVASPETLPSTEIPEIARESGDTLVPVDASSASGLVSSPSDAVKNYAGALSDPESKDAGRVVNDGFIKQMREVAASSEDLEDVELEQSWAPRKLEYAIRTSDGGALVFATMLREDSYTVKDGVTVAWPDGSPQKAFLSGDISQSGQLRYYHQLLLYVPASGQGKPYALGQYGGVVSGEGA